VDERRNKSIIRGGGESAGNANETEGETVSKKFKKMLFGSYPPRCGPGSSRLSKNWIVPLVIGGQGGRFQFFVLQRGKVRFSGRNHSGGTKSQILLAGGKKCGPTTGCFTCFRARDRYTCKKKKSYTPLINTGNHTRSHHECGWEVFSRVNKTKRVEKMQHAQDQQFHTGHRSGMKNQGMIWARRTKRSEGGEGEGKKGWCLLKRWNDAALTGTNGQKGAPPKVSLGDLSDRQECGVPVSSDDLCCEGSPKGIQEYLEGGKEIVE